MEQSPETVFESEIAAPARVAPRPIGQGDDRGAVNDVMPNVEVVCRNVAEEIAELRVEGIEGDDNNEPGPGGGGKKLAEKRKKRAGH